MRFEIPTIIPTKVAEQFKAAVGTQQLTDAGHTVVGFATMAAKKANDSRLDLNAKFEPQVREARKTALAAVKSVREARVRLESSVDPLVDRALERLPENVSDTVAEVRKVTKQAVATTDRRVVDLIEFATAIPAKPVRRTVATKAAVKTAAAKSAPKSTAKAAPATQAASKPASVRKARVAKPAIAKPAIAKPASAKPATVKTARKAA
jgi:hypothetical protein